MALPDSVETDRVRLHEPIQLLDCSYMRCIAMNVSRSHRDFNMARQMLHRIDAAVMATSTWKSTRSGQA
jgi:hypothetical protein